MKLVNFSAIYVMWLRELKRFSRAKSRIFGTIAIPFFFLLSLGFGLGPSLNLGSNTGKVNYLSFLVPGILGMTMLFNSMFGGLSVLWDKEFGFLKEILVAPVRRSSIVLGRIAGGMTTTLIQGILILLVSLVIGFNPVNIIGIILALLFMILISIGFLGFGIAFASIMDDTQGFSTITQFIVFPIFLLSGALFPLSNLPSWLKPITFADPLTYGVDGLRASLIGFSQFHILFDLLILVIFDLLMVSLGTWLFNRTEI